MNGINDHRFLGCGGGGWLLVSRHTSKQSVVNELNSKCVQPRTIMFMAHG